MINPLTKNTAIGGIQSRAITQGQIGAVLVQETSPKINLGEITGIDVESMTCDVKTYARGIVISNVPIAVTVNNVEQAMLSTPIVGQTCILITTSDLCNIALPIGMMSGRSSLPVYAGESLMKSKGGQLLSQDAAGNQVISSKSAVIEVQGKDGVKTESSFGRHERTTHSESIAGMARSELDPDKDLASGSFILGTSVEKYYSTIETTIVNPSSRYVSSNNGNPYINQEEKLQCIQRASQFMININYIRTSLNEFRLQMYNKSMSEADYIAAVNEIKSRMKTEFQIKKNLSLVIEKGTVLNYNPENVRDISNISKESVAKSMFDKNIVYRVKVVNPVTGSKLGGIYFDEEGNCMIDCKNLIVNAKYDADINSDSDETGEKE